MNGIATHELQPNALNLTDAAPGPRTPGPVDPAQAVNDPVPAQSWTPSTPGVFSIHVDSDRAAPPDAWGTVSNRGLFPFSRLGRLEHFCTTPAHYPVRLRFYVDAMAVPRPQPFQPPALAVSVAFTPSGGSPRSIAQVADSAPRYLGPGWPLAPSFGEVFAAGSSSSGALGVVATLNDADAGVSLTYRDSIACELVPCA